MAAKVDPSEYHTFYQSNAGYIIPTITGGASCASSIIIIYIVLRSKLNSAYHRIMVAMSLSNILMSGAMTLTTIPMPSDVIYTSFSGSSYGTRHTCVLQGLAYLIGGMLASSANSMLNIYYAFTIGFEMPEKVFRKWIEPLCYLAFGGVSITIPLFFEKYDVINPTPFEPYCSLSYYPYRCEVYEDIDCIHGNLSGVPFTHKSMFLALGSSFGILIISMFIIIYKFYRVDKSRRVREKKASCAMRNESSVEITGEEEVAGNRDSPVPASADASARKCYSLTKLATLQALMYISAYILTYIFTTLTIVETSPNNFPFAEMKVIQVLKVIFQPFQGFFNMMIFVYHKMHQLRRADEDLRWWGALKILLVKPSRVPEIVISRIENVAALNVIEMLSRADGNIIVQQYHEPISFASNASSSAHGFNYQGVELSNEIGSSRVDESKNSENLSGFASWLSEETDAKYY